MSILRAVPTEAELAILHVLWERGASTEQFRRAPLPAVRKAGQRAWHPWNGVTGAGQALRDPGFPEAAIHAPSRLLPPRYGVSNLTNPTILERYQVYRVH